MLIKSVFFGAAVATAASAHASVKCNIPHLNPATLQNIAVVELPREGAKATSASVVQSALQQDGTGSASNELVEPPLAGGGQVLGYTRLRIEFTPCETTQSRSYSEESRSPFERFLVGKADSQVLKFDAVVEPLGVKASSQLYSMLRNSAKDGQSWSTELRNDDYLLPYFRVDTASVLNFNASFQSEGSSKVEIGSTVLAIVEQGSKLIAPSALLITDENKPRFNDAANFIDESLSKLFNKKVIEIARRGISILPPEKGRQHLARIILLAPHPIKTFATAEKPGRYVGQWDIYAEELKKSLFADVTNNKADVTHLDPATVLNLKIGDKEILRDRLASSEAIGKSVKALAEAADTAVEGPAIGFCRLVATESAKVGLAPYDMAIAAWAYLADQGFKKAKTKAAQQACEPVTRSLTLPPD